MAKVSVIITSYLPESKKYLDLCVASINNLATKPYEVIIVGRPDYMPQYLGCHTVAPKQETFAPPVGLNCGIAHASRDTNFLFVINDDVILTKHCLDKLLFTYCNFPNLGLLMPVSNDQQSRYALITDFVGPQKYETWKPIDFSLMNRDSCYPNGLMFHDTLCLFAMLMSKQVHQSIGPFDEGLENMDDIDYSLRSRQKGFLNAIELSSLVWHFGGSSADITFDNERRKKGLELFNKKWSS